MQQRVKVNIDGAIVHAAKGSSILNAAIEYGICIPHLCHVPNLSDMGGCRLCIVEHVVDGRSKITASCTLNVQEGMVILANTDKIQEITPQSSRITGGTGSQLQGCARYRRPLRRH